MNLIVHAVASIVDAHTHYLDASSAPDYRARSQHGRSIRAKSVLASLGALRQYLGNMVTAYRDRVAQKRDVNELLRLNDYLLADIGLSRSDLVAVQAGIISLDELEAERKLQRDKHSKRGTQRVNRRVNAANETKFELPKCA